MAEYNKEWGDYVDSLLKSHSLSTRGAEKAIRERTRGAVSSTYINEWIRLGKAPEYQKAFDFLSIFDIDEAIKGFEILGLPIPAVWIVDNPNAYVIEIRKKRDISEKKAERIKEFVRQELENLE